MSVTKQIAARFAAVRDAGEGFKGWASRQSGTPVWRWRKHLLAIAGVALLVLLSPRLYAEYWYLRIIIAGDVDGFSALRSIGDSARPALLRLLRNRERNHRDSAAVSLRLGNHKGRAVVDALIRTAREDPDVYVRQQAINSLREIGDPRSLPALKDLEVPCAMTSMGDTGRAAMWEFVRWGRTAEIRASTLACLCDAFPQYPEVRHATERAFSDQDHKMRSAAVGCARRVLSVPEAITRLKPLLQDPVVGLRMTAASELGRLNDTSGFNAMLAMAANKRLSKALRARALEALTSIGDERAIPVLLEIYDTEDYAGLKSDAGAALSTLFPDWKQRRDKIEPASK